MEKAKKVQKRKIKYTHKGVYQYLGTTRKCWLTSKRWWLSGEKWPMIHNFNTILHLIQVNREHLKSQRVKSDWNTCIHTCILNDQIPDYAFIYFQFYRPLSVNSIALKSMTLPKKQPITQNVLTWPFLLPFTNYHPPLFKSTNKFKINLNQV